jgi:uncharacterized protein YjbJ (UPF0337 family)
MDEKIRREMREEGAENSIKGRARNLMGRFKDAAGSLTGDRSLEAEGKLDRAEGAVRENVGDVQRRIGEER